VKHTIYLIILSGCIFLSGASAQDQQQPSPDQAAADAEGAPQAADIIAEMKFKMQGELNAVAEELVAEQRVAEDLFLKWPLEAPTKSHKLIEIEIDKVIQREALAKYPPSEVDKYRRQAEGLFVIHKVGDMVKLTFAGNKQVSGALVNIDYKNGELTINRGKYKLDNLTEEAALKFNAAKLKTERAKYVREKRAVLESNRVSYAKGLREFRERQLYEAAGYIQIYGKWVPQKSYLEQHVRQRRTELIEKLRPMLEIKTYYDAGFVLFNGQWMTREEAEEQKALIADAVEAANAPIIEAVPDDQPTDVPAPKKEEPVVEEDLWD
jgi:hypothetical protein